ncbi:DNA-binding HxlR family transcriptional regulator [Pseudomonas sp. TE24901]
MSKIYTPATAAADVETTLNWLGGRWKLIICSTCSAARYSAIPTLNA